MKRKRMNRFFMFAAYIMHTTNECFVRTTLNKIFIIGMKCKHKMIELSYTRIGQLFMLAALCALRYVKGFFSFIYRNQITSYQGHTFYLVYHDNSFQI